MFAVVIGLIVLLCFKIINPSNHFKVESRINKEKKIGKIKDSNYEVAGWLRIQGTDVDVPVLYSDDKTVDFPAEVEDFVWINNYDKSFKRQMNISGHNIFNLSAHPKIKSDSFNRFESLMAFVYYDFAKDNEYIQLTVEDKDYVYKIFATGFIDKSVASFFPIKSNIEKDDVKELIEIFKEKSLYKYDTSVNANDKIISLSTCTRFYGADSDTEFYVVGRLMRDDEKINHYNVTKNKKYEQVLKKLKGDENNE